MTGLSFYKIVRGKANIQTWIRADLVGIHHTNRIEAFRIARGAGMGDGLPVYVVLYRRPTSTHKKFLAHGSVRITYT